MSVFLAWMPDDDAVRRLRSLCNALATQAQLAWRDDAQFHMTLRYLGETATDVALGALCSRVTHTARRHAHLHITLDRLERWCDDGGLVARAAPSTPLQALFADLERAAMACGFAREPLPSLPHVTLAYARRGERVPDSATHPARTPLPIPATMGCVSLVRTVRGGYDVLAHWPLADDAPGAVDRGPYPH